MTTEKLISYDEMKAALECAVAERGEGFVYPEEWKRKELGDIGSSCQYRLEDGTPGCIVGMAMSYLRPDVVLPEFTGSERALDGLVDDLADHLAAEAQRHQDMGATWGEALERAISTFEDYK